MKYILHLALVVIIFLPLSQQAQNHPKSYITSGTEFIFSFASIDNNGVEGGNIMRFSGWFHLQGFYHYDFGRSSGLMTGLALRNVGFIYNEQESGVKKKYRKSKHTWGCP